MVLVERMRSFVLRILQDSASETNGSSRRARARAVELGGRSVRCVADPLGRAVGFRPITTLVLQSYLRFDGGTGGPGAMFGFRVIPNLRRYDEVGVGLFDGLVNTRSHHPLGPGNGPDTLFKAPSLSEATPCDAG